jgi:hypothetical protein
MRQSVGREDLAHPTKLQNNKLVDNFKTTGQGVR